MSLHVYVKPYDECDIYDVARGEVRRVRLTYDLFPSTRWLHRSFGARAPREPRRTRHAAQGKDRTDHRGGLRHRAGAAVLFAREGAAVAVADIDKGRIGDTLAEIKGAGGRGHGIPCDLTRDADSRRIVREAVEALGGLDILWNNVGHPGPGRVEGIHMDDYDMAMTLNVRSVLITTSEAIPAMRARGGGASSSPARSRGSTARRSAPSTRRRSSA